MSSVTVNVASAAELKAALANASGGETIVLAPGDYGALSFKHQLPSEVTITSADADHPAVFERVSLNGASNLTFDHVVFQPVQNAERVSTSPLHRASRSAILCLLALSQRASAR